MSHRRILLSTTTSIIVFLLLSIGNDQHFVTAENSTIPPSSGDTTDLQCEAESAVLNTNADISAATSTLLTTTKDAILADFTDFCKIIGLKCTVDMTQYSTEFRTVCEANEGQFVELTYELSCETDTISPIEIPGTVILNRIPSCLGISCDLENLPSTIESYQTEFAGEIATEVDSALGDSVVCEVGSMMISNSTTSSSSSSSLLMSPMTRGLFLSVVVGTVAGIAAGFTA